MRVLWVLAGFTALLIGGVGIVLPVLPTTPFVILAAFAFGKGSVRLRNWLVDHAQFGPIIQDWEAHGAIAIRYKRIAYTVMGVAFVASIIVGLRPVLLVVQGSCLCGAAFYIHTRPTGPVSE